MKTAIYLFRDMIGKTISAISMFTDLSFSVVDENLLRVHATGIYASLSGLNVPEGTVCSQVLKSGRTAIVHDPKENPLCQKCPFPEHCFNESTITLPITFKGRVLGALSLGAVSAAQKQYLKDHEKQLESLLTMLCHQISGAIQGYQEQAIHKAVMDFVQEPLIIVDGAGNLIDYNDQMDRVFYISALEQKNVSRIISDIDFPNVFSSMESFGIQNKHLQFSYNEGLYSCSIRMIESGIDAKLYVLGITPYAPERADDGVPPGAARKQTASPLERIIGISEEISVTKQVAQRIAQSDANVLIIGESGVGKELFSEAIHGISSRSNGPFVAINCSAIPESLLESELFGYEQGAFTGASKSGKPGKFELADKGTLFLDEIGDMPLHLQPKILRAIETGIVTRVGGTEPIRLDVRIIAATHKDLLTMVKDGSFRQDLYYRLRVLPLQIPPLRNRKEDILFIGKHLLRHGSMKKQMNFKGFSDEVIEAFINYSWPGNVRELVNAIEYAVNMEQGDDISIRSIPPEIRLQSRPASDDHESVSKKDWELEHIRRLLAQSDQSTEAKVKIAEALGISLSTLYRRLRILSI